MKPSFVPSDTIHGLEAYVCPHCRGPLEARPKALGCGSCQKDFPVEEGIADFCGGTYYDKFSEKQKLPSDHMLALEDELQGTRARIERFYAPLIARRFRGSQTRVLDCGCGNGVAVDLLPDLGFETWGVDSSALRKWQWRRCREKRRLALANALALPFSDGFFDAVISSGVLEHVGVREFRTPRYSVEPERDQAEQRRRYLTEILRVVRRGGVIWIDAPNGRFPIDFWHSDDMRGAPRTHSPLEKFLPTSGEIRRLVDSVGEKISLRFLSPRGRFRFARLGRRWYGKPASAAGRLFFELIAHRPWTALAGSPLNPYLVAEILKQG